METTFILVVGTLTLLGVIRANIKLNRLTGFTYARLGALADQLRRSSQSLKSSVERNTGFTGPSGHPSTEKKG